MTLSGIEIIVVGGDHHNMLGAVRSLGAKGASEITAIITNDKPYSFVSKSKFIKKSYIVKEEESSVLELVEEIRKNLAGRKAIIIPTSDFAARIIDQHLNELSGDFIIPSIDGRQGMIAKYMDKYKQYLLAEKHNVKMAKCVIVDLNAPLRDLIFSKCIIKPLVSANGNKSDIAICNNPRDYFNTLKLFKGKKYEKVLVQEFIDFDRECGLIGCSNGRRIVLPGIIKKNRIYPAKRGSNSYSNIEKVPNNPEIKKIVEMLKKLKYDGLFDIEIFIKGNDIYLNEINFRNSGNTFAYCYDDIYIVYLWTLMALGEDIARERQAISESFSFIDERLEAKQLLDKNISLREYFRTKLAARARLLHYKKDIRPSIYKYAYAIRRKITR